MHKGVHMIGRRRPDNTKPWELEAGDYMKYKGRAFVVPPDGVGPIDVSSWSNVWHEDGTLTVSPSIGRAPIDGDAGWHGFLENGIWRADEENERHRR